MENDDFANVSWQNDAHGNATQQSAPGHLDEPKGTGAAHQGGISDVSHPEPAGDAMDLAGVGNSVLECVVGSPMKESDGTKDAYVSYLVTTHVGNIPNPELPY